LKKGRLLAPPRASLITTIDFTLNGGLPTSAPPKKAKRAILRLFFRLAQGHKALFGHY
jgi:hypothetical protein